MSNDIVVVTTKIIGYSYEVTTVLKHAYMNTKGWRPTLNSANSAIQKIQQKHRKTVR